MKSINFLHPVSISLLFCCVMLSVPTFSIVGSGSVLLSALCGITLAVTLRLSSKWMIRKE